MRDLLGHDDAGASFPVFEPSLSQADWTKIRSEPAGVLRASPFAALALDQHQPFVAAINGYWAAIAAQGAAETIERARP